MFVPRARPDGSELSGAAFGIGPATPKRTYLRDVLQRVRVPTGLELHDRRDAAIAIAGGARAHGRLLV